MSREETKTDLHFYLNDPTISVVALKGLWGTGKTFLWDEVKASIKSPSGKSHLYTSLFGIQDTESLKMRLFQSSFGAHEDAVKIAQRVVNQVSGAITGLLGKVVKGGDKGAALLSSMGGLLQSTVIDAALKERLIVLDDIERRGGSLEVGAVLGFIDDLRRKGCRVLLLFNEEPISRDDSSGWRALKEKCIDREVTLSTTPAEAAEIGISAATPYRSVVIDSLERADVTNIRVVQRIDRVMSSIFHGKANLPSGVVDELVPAVVMIAALNFNAVPGGSDIEEVVTQWRYWIRGGPKRKGGEVDLSPSVSLLTAYNLTRDMEFIDLVCRHVTTGRLLSEQFGAVLAQRETAAANTQLQRAARGYLEATVLNPMVEDKDFIANAEENAAAWSQVLTADLVSAIALDLESRGRRDLAESLVNQWSARWMLSGTEWDSVYPGPDGLHSVIKQALLDRNYILGRAPSLLDAVQKVLSGGWSAAEQVAINEAREDEITEALRSADGGDFATIVHFYTRELRHPTVLNGVPLFSKGSTAFIEVVRNIISEGQGSPRLVELLRRHFGQHIRASS